MDTDSASSQIRDLLVTIDQLYWGPQERALIDQALRLALEIHDEQLEYKVRMRLTSSAARTGDNDTLLTSFAWCLTKHDSDPERFPTSVGENLVDLMWQYKWVVEALDASTSRSLAECEAVLDQMEEHYRREGLGLSGVFTARFQHAWHTGRIDQAEQWREALSAIGRDEHSHCDACARSQLAGFATATGDDELALRLVDEILEGGFSCGEEPEHALSRTLAALLRAGRGADATAAHLRSYDRARTNPDAISIVADNIIFCAISGNEARGLALAEHHLPWLTVDPLNESGQLDLLVAVALACQAAQAVGQGDQRVRRADDPRLVGFFGGHDGAWSAAQLAPVARAAATRLASRFDDRNQNSYVSSTMTRTFGLANEHYDVPMHMDVFPPTIIPVAPPTTASDWLDLAEVYAFADLPELTVGAARHVLQFERWRFPHHRGEEPLSGNTKPVAGHRARAAQLLIGALVQLDREPEAQDVLLERQSALIDMNRDDQADMEKRLGLSLFGRRDDHDVALLEEELARLDGQASPELADVEITLGMALMRRAGEADTEGRTSAAEAGEDAVKLDCAEPTAEDGPAGSSVGVDSSDTGDIDSDESTVATVIDLLTRGVAHSAPRLRLQASALRGLALVKAAVGDLEGSLTAVRDALALPDLSDGLRAALLRHRARTLGGLGRYVEGAADADEATTIYARYQVSEQVIGNAMLAAALFADAGLVDDEVLRLRLALREAEQTQRATTGIRFQLGTALVMAGRPEEGSGLLFDVRQEAQSASASLSDQAQIAFALAGALTEMGGDGDLSATVPERAGSDTLVDAAGMYGEAAAEWEAGGCPLEAAAALHRQGTLLRQTARPSDAIRVLSRGYELARDAEATPLMVMLLEACALAKSEVGDASGLDDLDRCDALLRSESDPMRAWKLADLSDTRARILLELRRPAEAVEALSTAATSFSAEQDLVSSAAARHLQAQVLAHALKRPEDAMSVWADTLADLARWIDDQEAAGDEVDPDLRDLRAAILREMADTLDPSGEVTKAARAQAEKDTTA